MKQFKKTPKLVINLLRHGARGPLQTQDPYWHGKEGLLTTLGKAQHYVLGASLMQRYPHLKHVLKENDERIYLRSTEFARTKESLEYHLLGMMESRQFDLEGLDIFKDSFSKIIHNHSVYEGFMNADRKTVSHLYSRAYIPPFADDLEMLCTEPQICPNSFKMLGKEGEQFLESQMKPVCEKISKEANIKLTSLELRFFYDYILTNTFEGRNLPDGISPATWRYMKHAGEYYITYKRFGSEIQRKLFSMFLMNKLIDYLKGSKENTFPHDLVLIAAHDVTVFNLLNVLDILTPEKMYAKLHDEYVDGIHDFPNFASQILIELWETEDNKDCFVRVIYESKPLGIGEKLEQFYSLSAFSNLLKSYYAPYTEEDFFEKSGKENPRKQVNKPKEIA